MLAARGARESEAGGVEAIRVPEVVRQLKRRASHVLLEALAIAVVVIAVVMLARGLMAAHLPPSVFGPE